MKKLLLFLLLVLPACTSVGVVPTPTPEAVTTTPQTLHVVAPESLAPTMMALASVYQRENPVVEVVVSKRADTLALASLEEGSTDVAALTWLPSQLPPSVWGVPFARDGLAIVVNPQNGVPGLTQDQLRQLFRGQAEDWAPWGGLAGTPQLISREDAAGEYIFFQRRVMQENRVSLNALLAPTSEGVIRLVESDHLSVGYLSSAWLDGRVRALTVEGIPLTPETLSSGVYPLTRDLYLISLGEPEGAARDFVQWVLSPEGQDVVSRQHLLPAAAP